MPGHTPLVVINRLNVHTLSCRYYILHVCWYILYIHVYAAARYDYNYREDKI